VISEKGNHKALRYRYKELVNQEETRAKGRKREKARESREKRAREGIEGEDVKSNGLSRYT
jgi:hypothetical protein